MNGSFQVHAIHLSLVLLVLKLIATQANLYLAHPYLGEHHHHHPPFHDHLAHLGGKAVSSNVTTYSSLKHQSLFC